MLLEEKMQSRNNFGRNQSATNNTKSTRASSLPINQGMRQSKRVFVTMVEEPGDRINGGPSKAL